MRNEILVTGGEGFVGRNVMKLYGDQAQSFDIKSGLDVNNKEQLRMALENKLAVVHLAARISVPESFQDPEGYMYTNVQGTRNVVEAAVEAGCQAMLFYASAAARAKPGSAEVSPYGESKRLGEELLQEYKSKIHVTIFEPENIIGAGQSAAYAGALTIFARNAKTGRPIIVSGDGSQTRDFVYVKDMAQMTKLALEQREKIPSGAIYQVGTGSSVSIKEVAEMFAQRHHVPVEFDPNMPVGVLHSKAHNQPILDVVGGYTFTPWQDVIGEIVDSVQV